MSSFLACPRKEPKKARGASPLRPPRRLRLAFGQSRRRPVHGSMGKFTATHRPPRRGRNASAGEPPGPYRECALGRHGRFCVARSAHGEAENCAASPRSRALRANARNGRCFPPWVMRAIRPRSLGAQGARQLWPLPATDPAIGQADARAPHGRRVSDPPPCAPTRQVRRTVVSIVGCARNLN